MKTASRLLFIKSVAQGELVQKKRSAVAELDPSMHFTHRRRPRRSNGPFQSFDERVDLTPEDNRSGTLIESRHVGLRCVHCRNRGRKLSIPDIVGAVAGGRVVADAEVAAG
jgi:hypothetical protein